MMGVVDKVEGLTHLMYDDSRTRCGLWTTMWQKDAHDFVHVYDVPATCVVCACWTPQPLSAPLWRTWP